MFKKRPAASKNAAGYSGGAMRDLGRGRWPPGAAASGGHWGSCLLCHQATWQCRRCMLSHKRRQLSRSRSMVSVNTWIARWSSAHSSCWRHADKFSSISFNQIRLDSRWLMAAFLSFLSGSRTILAIGVPFVRKWQLIVHNILSSKRLYWSATFALDQDGSVGFANYCKKFRASHRHFKIGCMLRNAFFTQAFSWQWDTSINSSYWVIMTCVDSEHELVYWCAESVHGGSAWSALIL